MQVIHIISLIFTAYKHTNVHVHAQACTTHFCYTKTYFLIVDRSFHSFLEAWPKDAVPLVTCLLHHTVDSFREHGPVWVQWCFAFEEMLTLAWWWNHDTVSVAAQVGTAFYNVYMHLSFYVYFIRLGFSVTFIIACLLLYYLRALSYCPQLKQQRHSSLLKIICRKVSFLSMNRCHHL